MLWFISCFPVFKPACINIKFKYLIYVSLPTLIYNLENFIDLSWLIFHYDIFMCGLAAHVLYADKISVCNLSWFFQIYIFCLQLCTDNKQADILLFSGYYFPFAVTTRRAHSSLAETQFLVVSLEFMQCTCSFRPTESLMGYETLWNFTKHVHFRPFRLNFSLITQ